LPVIPGSSIKGVLKNVFPSEINESFNNEKKEAIKKKNENKLEYLSEVLENKTENPELIKQNWKKVFFERRQVFLEAYLTAVEANTTVIHKVDTGRKNNKGETFFDDKTVIEKHLFADDYITPHTEGIFKNPIPIRFLKVASGVTFTFQFILKDCMKSDLQKLKVGEIDKVIISKENILKVFKQIILGFGIGAKRNVGYGNFTEN
jgi:CRISPR-associated protein Cmr6